MFQSTHPRGVRLLRILESFYFPCFNPRTREGCDKCWITSAIHFFLFQSTHPRGVRRSSIMIASRSCRFQSTHPRGVRQSQAMQNAINQMFQSTHPRGVRRLDHIRD
mgnify:CR=1 FL=1